MTACTTVTVVGVGLIGGSFALALRRVGYRGRILGVSSEHTLSKALARRVIDEGSSLEEALPRSDLVYMAHPVLRIVEDIGRVRSLAADHALVTDAGSTKRMIVDRASDLFGDGPHFVGGHPMAGKEGRGVEVADGTLFDGATYALVPTGERLPDTPVMQEFRGWLDAMGCSVRVLRADEHDRVVGWTSHMPQLVSTALAAAIGDGVSESRDLEVAGNGLRDMTRLAASPHEVWDDILRTNMEPIDQALATFVREVESMRRALRGNELAQHFERGQAMRGRLPDD